MENITAFLESIPIDFPLFAKAALILLVGTLALSMIGRFVFGKKSTLSHAVASAIAVIFVYALVITLRSCGTKLDLFSDNLPFINIDGNTLGLFKFEGAHYTVICTQILSSIILAFLVNLAESWFDKGEKFFSWLLFRILAVLTASAMHFAVGLLFTRFLPEGLVTYAPTVLLGLLILLFSTGFLKIIIGIVVSTVNPVIGALYTFFFRHIFGKKITRALITTALLVALVIGLNAIGMNAISIAPEALTAYIPLLLILMMLWYLVNAIL